MKVETARIIQEGFLNREFYKAAIKNPSDFIQGIGADDRN